MPVDIKGKQYKTVAERIIELHSNTNGQYSINTEIINDDILKHVLIRATLSIPVIAAQPTHADVTGSALAYKKWNTFTGHAYEKQGAGFINKTSHIENAETSAIGRALASAGYLGGTEFASAEEVANAVTQQAKSTPTVTREHTHTTENGVSITGIL
jgi:hypothetical protein